MKLTGSINVSLDDDLTLVNATVAIDAPYLNDTSSTNFKWVIGDHKYPIMIIRGVIFLAATFSGIFGNTVCLIALRRRVLHTTSTSFLLGQVISDLFFLIAFAPTAFKVFDEVDDLQGFQTFYAYYISYFYPLISVFHCSCVWVTVSFTVARIISVAYPMKAFQICTRFRAGLALCCAFLFASVLNATRFFRRRVVSSYDSITGETSHSYVLTKMALNADLEKAYWWTYVLTTKLIPFPLLAFLNVLVITFVSKARKNREDKIGKSGESSAAREQQMTRILIAIVFAFLACNAAAGVSTVYIAIYGIQIVYTLRTPSMMYLFAVGETLINCNPLVNCILYTVCSQAMRKEVVSLFSCSQVKLRRLFSSSSCSASITGIRKSSVSENPQNPVVLIRHLSKTELFDDVFTK